MLGSWPLTGLVLCMSPGLRACSQSYLCLSSGAGGVGWDSSRYNLDLDLILACACTASHSHILPPPPFPSPLPPPTCPASSTAIAVQAPAAGPLAHVPPSSPIPAGPDTRSAGPPPLLHSVTAGPLIPPPLPHSVQALTPGPTQPLVWAVQAQASSTTPRGCMAGTRVQPA